MITELYPDRCSIRLFGYDYSQAGLYFVTICVQSRVYLFGNITDAEMVLNDAGKMVDDEWQYLRIKYPHIKLHEYVIMPNHFHGIVEITDNVAAGSARPENGQFNIGRANPAPTIGNIIGYFKYQTTKKLNLSSRLWQRNYYEHIIRNEKDYCNTDGYIVNNPYNWSTDNYYINHDL
ncbi:MAG: transposase [Prevotella sp.]|jgi:REP element-mobilizing transposase RayT|nr:transposase [Prevotella sp.]